MPQRTPPSDTPTLCHRNLPRGRQLVSAAWLAALLQGRAPEDAPPGPWRVFEVGEDAAQCYTQA
ncbi:MAG: sulfurtransferase, partial [Rhodoferax sp.]|nr:sulfurtransferase [Rhodoferax sp.]